MRLRYPLAIIECAAQAGEDWIRRQGKKRQHGVQEPILHMLQGTLFEGRKQTLES
jgi:hypothetical protein